MTGPDWAPVNPHIIITRNIIKSVVVYAGQTMLQHDTIIGDGAEVFVQDDGEVLVI